jgi:hypothetical protein
MSFARFHSRISLPRIGYRVGLRIVLFEDCTVFTLHYGLHTRRVTYSDPLHRRLQPLRYLHDCSDYFRLEQYRRVGFCTHWKSAAFARRTPKPDAQHLNYGAAVRQSRLNDRLGVWLPCFAESLTGGAHGNRQRNSQKGKESA